MNLRKLQRIFRSYWRACPPTPPYSHIVQIGDPILRCKAVPVNPKDIGLDAIQKLASKLGAVMRRYGAVGLSAPQLGLSVAMFALHQPQTTGGLRKVLHMQPYKYTVWINPEMKVVDYSRVVSAEGCESIHGYSAEVSRYAKIILTGLDMDGKPQSLEAEGWLARVIQHEMDHLKGRLFTEGMQPGTFSCVAWDQINRTAGQVYITYAPVPIKRKLWDRLHWR